MHSLGELPRFLDVRRRRLAPEHIRVRRVRDRARRGHLQTVADAIEPFGGPLAGDVRVIALIDVAGDQRGALRVGARHDQRVDAHHVRGQTGRGEACG